MEQERRGKPESHVKFNGHEEVKSIVLIYPQRIPVTEYILSNKIDDNFRRSMLSECLLGFYLDLLISLETQIDCEQLERIWSASRLVDTSVEIKLFVHSQLSLIAGWGAGSVLTLFTGSFHRKAIDINLLDARLDHFLFACPPCARLSISFCSLAILLTLNEWHKSTEKFAEDPTFVIMMIGSRWQTN